MPHRTCPRFWFRAKSRKRRGPLVSSQFQISVVTATKQRCSVIRWAGRTSLASTRFLPERFAPKMWAAATFFSVGWKKPCTPITTSAPGAGSRWARPGRTAGGQGAWEWDVRPPLTPAGQNDRAFATLRQFVRKRPTVECCEMCSTPLAGEHQHLIEPAARKIVCACDPCAILFSGQSVMKYKRIPRRIRGLPEFQMTEAQWDGLMIPIEMAFFFKSGDPAKVNAFYPGPAGATESLLSLEMWSEIEAENPQLQEMEPEVEALVANRVGVGRGAAAQYFVVPIDECYKLGGLIRLPWHGLSGGTEVWREVGKFFTSLNERAENSSRKAHA